ncbi:putative nad nadp octopine nopaline dehydrogenase [Diaporthe ampelina]|uniref:Putative nad nadp octopine nopaline dehydrogenase n=1 Tax=Diaporthe ampelina TaxID=1214573 RepID=A0A0G2G166_9PEZI|nr:putative nad nadp octopine nopaline dehydrogenase [Diaporthe ampelina]
MDMQLPVSILGAGPAGFALAADLQGHGRSVLLYSHPAHTRHADSVREKGCLRATGVMRGSTTVQITTDIGEVVAFSRVLILTVPSTGQETLLEELKGFDLRLHTLIAIPGNLFSLVAGAEIDVENILETNISPYSCRMEDGTLRVMGRKSVVSIAALRDDLGPEFYAGIQGIFSPVELRWCSSVVEVSLSNINGVFHPLMMLMNAGRIESTAGGFLIYRDGLTRSVANAMLAVDRVRIEVGAKFGLRLKSTIDVSNECYNQGFTDLVDLAQNSPPHNKLKAPADIDNRNISEDVPDLLVAWHALAEKLGIDASPITAVIILVEMATGIKYMRLGRNLRKLHLEDVPRGELIARFSPWLIAQNEVRL